ncbi:Cof-type HAD-IIB family hydrolase [Marinicrinis lubricantis]|uniref:Cof-type HAD-IIB family hydrolase n=1 Tax=Marinicrinis lubricantis TaxID=2086470 RepID=A0ABW1IUI1_9BACL
MTRNYKLLALDMDGTLLDDHQEISETNQHWLRMAREAGVTVCISTGRGMHSLRPYVEQLQLTSPLVTVNGSEVWENPSRVMSRHTMKLEWIMELRELALSHDVWYWAYSTEGVFNKETWYPGDPASVEWLKFGYYIEDLDVLKAVKDTVSAKGIYEITNSHPNNLELNPPGVSKASGLRQVCELLGIGMDQVIAVGDSLNDLSMIEEAGLGIAMGNAQEAVKERADDVTLTNAQDGVAHVVRKYIAAETM